MPVGLAEVSTTDVFTLTYFHFVVVSLFLLLQQPCNGSYLHKCHNFNCILTLEAVLCGANELYYIFSYLVHHIYINTFLEQLKQKLNIRTFTKGGFTAGGFTNTLNCLF